MFRRSSVFAALIMLVALAALGPVTTRQARAADKRPNVVLIMTDDQGYGDLAVHGNKALKTPNLDSFHSQAVRFTDFHVDPTCAETRAALMTGRYATRTGVWHTIMGRSLLRPDEKTVADHFAASGYATGIFGKWHLGDTYPLRPQDRGFQEVLIHGGGGVGQTPDYFGNDYFDDTYFHNGQAKKFKGYCTDVWFDGALNFIESHKDKPFFCYIPTNAAHGPFLVADKYRKIYEDQGIKGGRAAFYGMITNIDENFGRLTKKLDELKLTDNTIVIFMTDNGTAAGESGGFKGKKGSQYEGGHHVPFLIRWPGGGVTGGRDVNKVAAHIDLLPTFKDVCGLKDMGVNFDGTSIAPLMKGKTDGWPDRTLFVHRQRMDHPKKYNACSVMTDKWRLVNHKELYAWPDDRAQKTNMADKHPQVVKQLQDQYETWWKSISTRFDEYVRPIVGSDKENPATLTCHDWHTRSVPWNQRHIKGNGFYNGYWTIHVERDGEYEVELRRWPREVDKGIEATGAKIKLGDVEMQQKLSTDAKFASFSMTLKKGPAKLQTWLTTAGGKERGAYYVYVKYLGK